MAIAGVDRYGAASGLQPLDRVSREQAPLAPDLAEANAAKTQTIFQALQPPTAEARQLETLVASARAASIAIEAGADETDDADPTAIDAAGTDEPATVDDLATIRAETFAAPSAQDVASNFEAVAALVPTERTLAPAIREDETGLSVEGVTTADSAGGFPRAYNPPPGELLSRFA